jgi:hypothetical protein
MTPGLGFFGHPPPPAHAVGTSSVRDQPHRERLRGYSVPSFHRRFCRAVLSTGSMAVQTGQWFRLPAPSPVPFWLQRFSLLRWVKVTMAHHTFAGAAHRCLLNGIPGLRLPGSAIDPRFRPLRTVADLGDMLSLLHQEGGTSTLMNTA